MQLNNFVNFNLRLNPKIRYIICTSIHLIFLIKNIKFVFTQTRARARLHSYKALVNPRLTKIRLYERVSWGDEKPNIEFRLLYWNV